MKGKIIVYQLMPRLFGNSRFPVRFNGNLGENGCGKFNDISNAALAGLRQLGVTHIWLTGVIRHSTQTDYAHFGLPSSHPDIVKGKAGSPYAINDYYDLDPDLACHVPDRWKEFDELINRIHQNGFKVIIDFVPNHVARDYYGKPPQAGSETLGKNDNKNVTFSPSNNFYYMPGEWLTISGLDHTVAEPYREYPARATGNDVFRPDPNKEDWYETVKLNYGYDYANRSSHFHPLPDTWIKMTGILLFWSARGIDGFRCDMAGMVPVEFWQYALRQVKTEYPEMLFIAELYEPQRYRNYLETGLFDYLYDKVGWYDAARQVIAEKASTRLFTGVWQKLEGMDNQMLRFLENHDEQRIASKQFAGDPVLALPAFALAAFMHSGPVMLYSGQEVGEPAAGANGFSGDDGRTSIFDYGSMPELCKWYNGGLCDGGLLSVYQVNLRNSYARILNLAESLPHFSQGSFYDLMWVNEDNPFRDRIFAFLRYGGSVQEEILLVAVSMDRAISSFTVRIPEHALEMAGIGGRQRYSVRDISPETGNLQGVLNSQLTSSGIRIKTSEDGYSILGIS